jgi:glutamate synthase (NADPH/NADH) small chain
MGHKVTVYEREDRVGGLLMYGIPNMKLDKSKVGRRVELLAEEGIDFLTNTNIGANMNVHELTSQNDAVILCIGASMPRDLQIPGRQLNGIHFAMEFLTKNQKRLMMTKTGTIESGWDQSFISAEGKDVVIIGGGDTGTDCIGTSVRHRCRSIVNFELMPRPPDARAPSNPWPQWPRIYGLDYGHAEVLTLFGKDPRQYSVLTTEFRGEEGQVKSLVTNDVRLTANGPVKIPGTEREWPADLVVISMGFVSPEDTLHKQLQLQLDSRQNIYAEYGDYQTSVKGVFAAGDCRRGQSLVVWAINEGRGVAAKCNEYLSS